ncbi:class I SAM-dependent methyltransferase [Paenibacillus allorhizosphaerae]|uniref:Trans-aconitate 2-methyltransferase n=1 Tax=Paenibacillus allorhizosphaerae TaxID=2849866 RepID=A0ABM8VAM6_9BACL|nr:class I SAM-dependent methyltransferase [Paenibacillus allorhizosphaerae]CAG7616925.1 Trans-aconitate 2-methyltransferase [Paenibacillus allorhizosphaerae]
MDTYYWDTRIDYLRSSRDLYYNDDYIEFLVKMVWKIEAPVHLIDFGCGYGYLGLKLLPLLPDGSTYTGVDLGEKLLDEARSVFQSLPYESEFIRADIQEVKLERKYDIALCHAVLLHMPNPVDVLKKMIDCVVNQGRIITFEPHWIGNMANYYLHGHDHSRLVHLGILQKLYEQDTKRSGKDGNIGAKVPIYLSELGLTDIESRVSDKVIFLHPNMDPSRKMNLYQRLQESGHAEAPSQEREAFISQLMERGARFQEAQEQYENELYLSKQFHSESFFTYACNMKITFGTVSRDS